MQPKFQFLSGGGELGALMREYDWARGPLGPPDGWPESLKTALHLLLTSNHPMFIWWGADLIQFYNDAYRKTMGPERHPSALGQPGRECWTEVWDIIGPQIELVMAGGGATWHENQLVPVTRHGRREDVYWTYGYSPIEDSSGVRGVLVVCTDVTEQHQAREQLRELNRQLLEEIARREEAYQQRLEAQTALAAERADEMLRLKALFAQAPGFVCILRGPTHIFEFANAAYLRLIGDRDCIGKPVRTVLPEVEGQGFFERLDQVFATGTPYPATDVSIQIRKSSGGATEQVFLDFLYQPIVEVGGVVSGIFVQGIDATERHVTKRTLELSEQRLKEGMLAARMVIWDWDIATQKIRFSENTASILGGTWTDLAGVRAAIHPGDRARIAAIRDDAIARCDTYADVIRLARPDDGTYVWLQVYGKVLSDEQGIPRTVRGAWVDVSERKKAELALEEQDRKKTEFLAMLAHELRNPLAPIRNGLQIMRLASDNPEVTLRAREMIERQVGNLVHLVDDLLDIARVTGGKIELQKEAVSLKDLITGAVETSMPAIESGRHDLDVRLPDDSMILEVDATRIVQVLSNLLNNAAKYTPQGGKIILTAQVDGDHVLIAVTDNGVGLDEAALASVFEMFSQVKENVSRAQGGLGVGLALVRRLVELHGGTVRATSLGKGKGSTFEIALPMGSHQAQPSATASMSPRRNKRKYRILIVDDNLDAADSLSILLRIQGHTTSVLTNGLDAIRAAAAFHPAIVFLDIGMPGLDGYETARRLRSLPGNKKMVLVALTGWGTQADRAQAKAAGFDHHLIKPAGLTTVDALLSEIDGSLNRVE